MECGVKTHIDVHLTSRGKGGRENIREGGRKGKYKERRKEGKEGMKGRKEDKAETDAR